MRDVQDHPQHRHREGGRVLRTLTFTLTLTLTLSLTLTLTLTLPYPNPNPNPNPNQADEFFAALKRRFYVTPKSFLELLSLYSSMLDEKRELMDMQIERLSIGCAKLNATNSMVQRMKKG